jgi:hypothetical protein
MKISRHLWELVELERKLTSRVPGPVGEIHYGSQRKISSSGITCLLLEVGQGWVVGGYLAKRVLTRRKADVQSELD